MENSKVKPESQNKKLKVLWSSNAAFAPTGYGTVTGNLVYRLLNAGYDLRVAANYGLEGAALRFNNLLQYPRLFTEFSEDALFLIIDSWKPDVLITLNDVWVGGTPSKLNGKPHWFAELHPRWIAYFPVDSYPVADPVLEEAKLAYKAVSMSKYGQDELARNGLKSTLIPHGVETSVFKPHDKKAAKTWLQGRSVPMSLQQQKKINPETFVVGINASNKDPFRKDFARMFSAFQMFLEQNPDARKDSCLYLHTWIQFPGGFDLEHLARKLQIENYVKHSFAYDMLCSYPSDALCAMYNAFDVFLNLCRGGGFELGHIESASCGTPSIGVDFTSMPELIRGHGWLVPLFAGDVTCPHCQTNFSYHNGAKQVNPLLSPYGIPDEYKTAEALEDAYNHPSKILRYSKDCREFALGYDYDRKIIPLWQDLLGEIECELGMFGKYDGKDQAFDKIFAEATAT
jgi:glycosyltransferase involved in cell wall biosynthesis